ncbi:hypothetical protein [Hyalangium gracile]|uniref:hypothetical protein n=1 Tax=Hyalangium gracile TaxID=394092 RepID=UPI001CCBC0D9|nr:hypothetical protein [Hyalangium gracile]
MMENAMSRQPGAVMSTTAKPMKKLPPAQQEVKVFYRPRFGIRAESGGLSVDVSARPQQDSDDTQRG